MAIDRKAILDEAAEIAMDGWHSVEKARAFACAVSDYLASTTGEAEPVAEIVTFGGLDGQKEVSWRKGKMPPLGTKLYATPPAVMPAASSDAVIEILALVRSYGDARQDGNDNRAAGWIRDITAALQAPQPEPAAGEQAGAVAETEKKTHGLKTDPDVFDAVWNGLKTFEIRFNDRDFKVGDWLNLHETKHSGEDMKAGLPLIYTGRSMLRKVSHVLSGYGLAEGWVCLSLAAPSAAIAAREQGVDEATAMKGGRWVSADDIEHMTGELLSLATGDPYTPTKMVDAFHTLRAALASREQELPEAKALADSEGSRAVKYLRIIRKVRAVVDEWPEVDLPDSPLARIRTIIAFAGSSLASRDEAPATPQADDSGDLAARLLGRAQYIRDQGGVKSAELMEAAAARLTQPTTVQQAYRVFMDGDQWFAVGPAFVDLQQSPAGFADTPYLALERLTEVEGEEKRRAARKGMQPGERKEGA